MLLFHGVILQDISGLLQAVQVRTQCGNLGEPFFPHFPACALVVFLGNDQESFITQDPSVASKLYQKEVYVSIPSHNPASNPRLRCHEEGCGASSFVV